MIRTLITAALTTVFFYTVNAQKLTTAQVQNLVNSKHYTFQAHTMNQTFGQKYLTQNYFLQVADDSLISSLPYVGVAYTAPINSADAGYNFVSTNFDYAVTEKKKNSYQITIHTKNRVNTADFILTVYNNGRAFLQVNSFQEEPISYNGYLK